MLDGSARSECAGDSAQTLPRQGWAKLFPKPPTLSIGMTFSPKRASPFPYSLRAFFKPAVGKRSASGRRRKGKCGQLAHRVSGRPHACHVDGHVVQHGATVTGSELTVCASKPVPGGPGEAAKSSCRYSKTHHCQRNSRKQYFETKRNLVVSGRLWCKCLSEFRYSAIARLPKTGKKMPHWVRTSEASKVLLQTT